MLRRGKHPRRRPSGRDTLLLKHSNTLNKYFFFFFDAKIKKSPNELSINSTFVYLHYGKQIRSITKGSQAV